MEVLEASSAELVQVHPCGHRGNSSPAECTDVIDFASRLWVHIRKLRPIPASRHAAPFTFIFKDLATASHIFLRQGVLRGAPKAPYVSPYRFLHRGDKTYTIDVHVAATKVSIDCLKPAYVLHVNTESTLPLAIPSSITTRSGRRVGFPDYLGGIAVSAGGWCSGRH